MYKWKLMHKLLPWPIMQTCLTMTAGEISKYKYERYGAAEIAQIASVMEEKLTPSIQPGE